MKMINFVVANKEYIVRNYCYVESAKYVFCELPVKKAQRIIASIVGVTPIETQTHIPK